MSLSRSDQIRLEVLKLAHRHDRSPAQVVEVASLYEAFVTAAPLATDSQPLPAGAAEAERKPSKGTLRLNPKK